MSLEQVPPSPSKHALEAAQLLENIRNELQTFSFGTEFEELGDMERKHNSWWDRAVSVKSDIHKLDKNIENSLQRLKSFSIV
jgi:hypothetical protein